MEVTRLNFYELLPEIKQTIEASVFLAIDGEFTGLNSGQEVHGCETPDSYYAKLRNSSLEFLFIQFGLAAFFYNSTTDKFTHKAYNFYLFPRPVYRGLPNSNFLCQAACMDFLVNRGFDFNKLFRDGIPYLNQPEELLLRDHLVGAHKARMYAEQVGDKLCNPKVVEIPPNLEETIEKAMLKIGDFLSDKNKTEASMVVGQYSGFERKLIYQEVNLRFCKDTVALSTGEENTVVVTRYKGVDERLRANADRCESEIRGVDHALGFAKMVKLITESGKWVVGHNMFLDLCHMLKRFCLPLPHDYLDYKDMLHALLPKLFDTKILCASDYFKDILKSSSLIFVLPRIQEPPFVFEKVEPEGDPKYGYMDLVDREHEAAYDAYITGLVYLGLSNYVGSQQDPPVRPVLPDSPLLQNYTNKLFLMKVTDTYINLEGPDPIPDRQHVFHVAYPIEWKVYNIDDLFQPFAGGFISVLEEGSAYVTLYNKSMAELVHKHLIQYPQLQYGVVVTTYAKHQELMNRRHAAAAAAGHEAVYVPGYRPPTPTGPKVWPGRLAAEPVMPGAPYFALNNLPSYGLMGPRDRQPQIDIYAKHNPPTLPSNNQPNSDALRMQGWTRSNLPSYGLMGPRDRQPQIDIYARPNPPILPSNNQPNPDALRMQGWPRRPPRQFGRAR